jgi:hypothetical protein
MAITLYSTGTEYTSNAITLLRGTSASITNVGVYHNTNPAVVPTVAEFTSVTLADGTNPASPNYALAIPGELDVVALIGTKSGAQLSLTGGDVTYQRWVLVQTSAEDIIRATDTVTVL